MTRETSGPNPEATRGCRKETELTLEYSEMLPRYCACSNPYVSLGVKLHSTQSMAKKKRVHNLTSDLPISIISTSSADSVGLSGEESAEVDQVLNKNRKKYQPECNLNVNPSKQALFSQLCYDLGATIFFRLQQNVNLCRTSTPSFFNAGFNMCSD